MKTKAKIRISIGLLDDNDDYQQYENMIATLIFSNGDKFVLDVEPLDTESDESNLDILESFCTQWEIKCQEDNIPIEYSKEVDDWQNDLECNIEQEKIEFEKTLKRCQN